MRTSWIAAIVAVVVGISVTVQGPTASAQIPPPPNPSPTNRVPLATPQRGDAVYAFSDEQPWNDPRVGLALAVMIDQQLTASVRGHILPANEQLRVASAPDQALQLLAAAGYPGRSPFRELRPCLTKLAASLPQPRRAPAMRPFERFQELPVVAPRSRRTTTTSPGGTQSREYW